MQIVLAAFLSLLSGCAFQPRPTTSDDVVFILPGVGGLNAAYGNIVGGLRDAGRDDRMIYVAWGAPPPLFFLNFQTESIHDEAETRLARRLEEWWEAHPSGDITLVGHSAGCGVSLGALKRLDGTRRVRDVILLAPSVSPGYDLTPSARRVSGGMHVFHSDRDTVFLKFRTETFGTYDNVRTPAAGRVGFRALAPATSTSLPANLAQHPYDPTWSALGNDGGHFGPLSRKFFRDVVAPMLAR